MSHWDVEATGLGAAVATTPGNECLAQRRLAWVAIASFCDGEEAECGRHPMDAVPIGKVVAAVLALWRKHRQVAEA
jgi:hypothetical protein